MLAMFADISIFGVLGIAKKNQVVELNIEQVVKFRKDRKKIIRFLSH